jgi:ribonuclease HI
MKCIAWNARGLANSPTRLALKKIINDHKPDIILLAEPWMDFSNLPSRWLANLNLKLFASNSRPNLLPNLWCLCKLSISPTILALDDQQVTFTICENNNVLAFSAVYASTNYLTRRKLWSSLNLLQTQHSLPWCFLGDFNVILGAHEHRGRSSPARLPIEDFQEWTNSFNLIHLPTRGAEFTWSNGRGGIRHTERRLDRVICNQAWLDTCCVSSVTSLIKLRSDHFPLLFDFKLTTTKHASQFKFLRMWSLHPDCWNVISECWNTVVVGCPMFVLTTKLKMLKAKLKSWNKDCFGNVNDLVSNAEMKLDQIQMQIQQHGHSEALLFEEKQASLSLEDALSKQDLFWQEKARLTWHLEGDRNTKFFHRLAKIKTSTKQIHSLQDGETVITDPKLISDHIVNFYKNLFCSNFVLQDSLLAEEVIPPLVTNDINALMTVFPSHSEIKSAVFALNKDSAPGPDGFGAFFYQHFWEIVKHDVVNAVLQFFTSSWILPGFNSNIIALLPKSPEASSIDQYRPIAMANFKFKIISKIIADRLASIMPTLISVEQKGFIHGRDIKDCLCTASEAINLLHNRAFGGNVALKIDITKAFDSLEWNFLLKVLKLYGFNETFCNWIHVILQSAYLSVSINGKSHGYFQCNRGVRQGDPLSPLLFCLAEDVLSRSISNLVSQGRLNLIKGTRNVTVPSHSFYADDLMIFCKGNIAGLRALKELFNRYALESGQVINNAKSTIFHGSITNRRLLSIVDLLNFKVGSLPFLYLGVPIFKGKPKVLHLQPIADKIKLKLSAWKASLLSIAGRIQLIKSVIQSMLTYSISLYSWPVSLLKDLERCIRNFIWSGDIEKRKLVTISWKKICRPLAQGGLNIRSLIHLNKASNLKLCWNMVNSHTSWALLLKDRVFRKGKTIQHHIFSSIWSSIKEEFNVIKDNTVWLVGNGERINFWLDSWCGDPLVEQLGIPDHARLVSQVSDFIVNGHWSIPPALSQMFPNLYSIISHVSIPLEVTQDTLIWKHTDNGDLELKQAYDFMLPRVQDLHWAKMVWNADIPSSKSFLAWRLMHEKLPTDENLMTRGCAIPSMCSFCHNHVESSFHIFFQCDFAIKLWSWLAGCLNTTLQFTSMDDMWKLCDSNWSPQGKVTIIAAIINLLHTIWIVRNKARFNDTNTTWLAAISKIITYTALSGNNTKKLASNSMRDFTFLKNFKVQIHHSRVTSYKEVYWYPPLTNWIKCNIDGASSGNPGNAACGGIFRDHEANFVHSFAEHLGVANSYFAEMCGAMRAIEIAYHNQWSTLWLETDSTTVVAAFNNPDKPVAWSLRNRWKNVMFMIRHMTFMVSHIYREGNQVADLLANYGLSCSSIVYWNNLPLFAKECFDKNKHGSPNFRLCTS